MAINIRFFQAVLFSLLYLSSFTTVHAQRTEIQYLSGRDKDVTVQWDFMCTSGRNSGNWTKIAVPSNWEFQGFGNYTYGSEKEDVTEAGMYRHRFEIPSEWAGKEVSIVFDGSMTDTEVKINGQSAGAIHQGAFYRFRYDITSLLKSGENLLEVKVNKVSSNQLVNEAERSADFWVFGGIFRPVFLEAVPKEHLERVAVDAKGDGSIRLNAFPLHVKGSATVVAQVLTREGKPFGPSFRAAYKERDSIVHLQSKFPNAKLWSTEFPNLYKLQVRLEKAGKTVHEINETIGFRTVELRSHDGFYVNGQKIRLKGVNRGSFWPNSGRTTSREVSLLDANLIKDMNMNAVRMSHYPPDDHFLQVCDSLGLLVIDELTGWQYPPYDTKTGRKLVKELILKDVNHPSVVLWANGNEGGFNFDLLPDYPMHDIQQRPVIQPWMNINGMNTKHYIPWNYGINTFFQGNDVFFPTEFLHGLYDGGNGAGLDDYWNLMLANPLSAGGFLWDFCDQAALRTDRNGQLDTKGNAAADGILGPYREKEGSFYTIREIWSPVYFLKKFLTDDFNGKLQVENRYHYTNLNLCSFTWRLKKINSLDAGDTASVSGSLSAPDIAPQNPGTLNITLPKTWKQYDVVYVTAKDLYGREINTWSWVITKPNTMAKRLLPTLAGNIVVKEENGKLLMSANDVDVTIDLKTGLLDGAKNNRGPISLSNGPLLLTGDSSSVSVKHYDTLGTHVVRVNHAGSQRFQFTWTMLPSGIVSLKFQYRPENNQEMLGINFNYPESNIQGIQLAADGPYHVYKNRMKGTNFDSWTKAYNNTVTGETWNYPEFKGYYSNFYAGKLKTNEGTFLVFTETENLFLHLFSPAVPKGLGRANSMAVYPKAGGISFMQGITAIGTKSQKKEDLGPQSQNNITFANGGNDTMTGVLYFDFR